jgi:mono/diheme cytochrome c family protein
MLAMASAGCALALGVSQTTAVSGQEPPDSVFTAAQATAGKTAYGTACARCHMPDLGGNPDAPPLAGAMFLGTWRSRTTKELFDFVAGTMPPGGSSMPPESYAAILAYVLQSNGAKPGASPLEPSTTVPLERVTPDASASQ